MNDDCRCKFCSTKRLHMEETMTANGSADDDTDLDDLPGYRPARQSKLEPIEVAEIDWNELSAFGDGVTANAAESDADGLVTNERPGGGIPETTIDYESLSVFRPRR